MENVQDFPVLFRLSSCNERGKLTIVRMARLVAREKFPLSREEEEEEREGQKA